MVMMAALGYNPFTVYLKMIKGALGSRYNITATDGTSFQVILTTRAGSARPNRFASEK